MTSSLDPDTIDAALELAVRAPSIHNSQPWRFRVGAGTIQLHVDPTRQLPATDPDGRDRLISCGAALHHLRVALAGLGWQPKTDRLPDPDRPEHLATVEVVPRVSTHADLALAVSIPRRRSDRRGYSTRPVPDHCLAELVRGAAAERVRLHVVHGEARAHLVSAIADADTLQRADPAYVKELARWTGRRTGTADGVPSPSFAPAGTFGDLPVRQFSAPRLHRSVVAQEDGAGALIVLGTAADDRMSRLRAGEATSAVLLAATRMGLATCPLTQPLEIPATREVVREEVLHAELVPQMVLRIGWPPDGPNPFPLTRRRPVSDVTECLGQSPVP